MKKPKFTLVDYLIIIVVIATVLFAFIHITSDDQNDVESTSYDSSTLNKVVEKYLNYYNQNKVVETSIEGVNSSNNEPVNLKGEVVWMDDDRGSNVKVLVKSGGETYLCGLYKDVPKADIYIDKMSLEVDGSTYNGTTEFTIRPTNVTTLNDLNGKLANSSNYVVTTEITVDDLDSLKYQELINSLFDHGRVSIKSTNVGLTQKLVVVRATPDDLSQGTSILGNIHGLSEKIYLRVYNCTDSQKELIENNFDVLNVKTY